MNYISKETFKKIHDDPRMAHIYNELFPNNERWFECPRTEDDIFHFFKEAQEYLQDVSPDWDAMLVSGYNLGIWVNKCMNIYSCKYEKHAGFLYKKQTGRFYNLEDFSDVTDILTPLADNAMELESKMMDCYPWIMKQILQGLRSVCTGTFNKDRFCEFIWTIYK